MSKKIKEVSESIKSKLSFDDYTPSIPNAVNTEEPKNIKTEAPKHISTEKPRKVKRTFYILESVAEQFDEYYARCLTDKKKIDKSDIITQAIINLIKDESADVKVF